MPDAVVSDEVLEKAHRLLAEGRLTVTLRTPTGVNPEYDHVDAVCTGDHGEYRLLRRNRIASCTCPSPKLCAHLLALSLVIDPAPAAPAQATL